MRTWVCIPVTVGTGYEYALLILIFPQDENKPLYEVEH